MIDGNLFASNADLEEIAFLVSAVARAFRRFGSRGYAPGRFSFARKQYSGPDYVRDTMIFA